MPLWFSLSQVFLELSSMLTQDLDTVKLNRSREISYFVPNNIGMLMSISSKSADRAKEIFNKKFKNNNYKLDITKLDSNK